MATASGARTRDVEAVPAQDLPSAAGPVYTTVEPATSVLVAQLPRPAAATRTTM